MKCYFCTVLVAFSILLSIAALADDMPPRNATPPRMPDGYPALSEESYAAFTRYLQERGQALRVERERVAILVDSPLWVYLEDRVTTFTNDVMNQFPVDLLVCTNQSWRYQSHTNVRQYIQALYTNENISGAVLVGFFPYMVWRTNTMRYPVTINYEDLDGGFRDIDGDGDFEEHIWAGNGLEIWISLLRPYQPTSSSLSYNAAVIGQLQEYFDKCHRYYSKELVFNKRAFIYVNEPWWWCFGEVQSRSEMIYGTNNTDIIGGRREDSSLVYGNGHDYLVGRAAGCELLNIWCHSAGYGHTFDQGAHLAVWSKDLAAKNGANGLITILWACYGSDYGNLPWGDPTGCLGQRYAMEANGLASVGVAKSGYTFGMEQTIEGLANGLYLGQSFLETVNWQYEFNPGFKQDFNFSTNTHVFGQTLIGNPFMYATAATNMSGPMSSINGAVVWSGGTPVTGAVVTVWKDNNIQTITHTDSNGQYAAEYLTAGTYIVDASDRMMINAYTDPVTLGTAEHVNSCTVTLTTCHLIDHSWYFMANKQNKNQMPSDWNQPGCDMVNWGTCILPLTKHEGGTPTNFAPQVYLRKNFVVHPGDEKVFLNVSADNGIEVYVNSVKLSVTPALGAWNLTRADLDYWNYRIDITSRTSTGMNYVVVVGQDAWGGNFIDASLYVMGDKPRMTVSRDAIRLVDPYTSCSFIIHNAGTGSFAYTIGAEQESSWLSLDKTNGYVAYQEPATVTLAVDRSGIPDGYYNDMLIIDAGTAGQTCIPVEMVSGMLPVTNFISAEWCTNSATACNPNGCWEYVYAPHGDRSLPYTLFPHYSGYAAEDGWLAGSGQCGWYVTNYIFAPMVAFDYASADPDDTAIRINTDTNRGVTAIGWRAPRDGTVTEIYGMWQLRYISNAVNVYVDHTRGNDIIETLYAFTDPFYHTYWDLETIHVDSPVYVEQDDVIYIVFERNEEIYQAGTLLFGTRWDNGANEYRITFLPIPEPVLPVLFLSMFCIALIKRGTDA